jgi:hypothetical protein
MEVSNIESEAVVSETAQTMQKRKRKKTNYKKINNQTRQKLIELVNFYLIIGIFE